MSIKDFLLNCGRLTSVLLTTPLSDLALIIALTLLLDFLSGRAAERLNQFRASIRASNAKGLPRKFFWCSTALMMLAWLPYFLTFYPGTGMQDEIFAMRHPVETSNQPLMYNALLRLFWDAGKFVGDETSGLALLTLIEMFMMSAALSFLLRRMDQLGAPRGFLIVNLLVFAFLPIFPNYAVCLLKDKLFAVWILLIVLFLFDNVDALESIVDDRRKLIRFVALCVLITVTRNNGLYVVGTCVVIACLMTKHRLRMMALIACCVLINSMPKLIFHIAMPFKEAVAIPLAQIGRTLASGGDISVEQRAFLDRIMPTELWAEKYSPWLVDGVKWSDAFDADYLQRHKKEFLTTWSAMATNNVECYVNAYCMQTYDFWAPGRWLGMQSVFVCAFNREILNVENPSGNVNDRFIVGDLPLMSSTIKNSIGMFMRDNVFYLNAGTCACIMLISIGLCTRQCSAQKLISLVPLGLCWMTLMLSAPIACGFRYVFMIALCMPFVLLLPMLPTNREAC